jgi:hypothetical protein
MDFVVTLTQGGPKSFSGDDAHYTVDEESGVLSVTDGTTRIRYSPVAWLSVEDDFGQPSTPPSPSTRG